MRSTAVARSGGHIWWGTPQLKQVGFYEYGVSPFQQKLFKGFFNPGLFKFAKKYGKQAVVVLPPALFYLWLSQWADAQYEANHRKGPDGTVGGGH
ncbi:hypothetical protein HK098_007287 [Nowakowskiella sp. JEL0407]|nr:hypothetical protein HK098_007275 [Nowakowskiella sp. JEL0407]KAJ3126693.1 hypothetical protein HK098_007287 [Nowakowskiella sp. JEL0407]